MRRAHTPQHPWLLLAAAVLLCAPGAPAQWASPTPVATLLSAEDPEVPFVPTTPEVVEAMLALAGVTGEDTLYDLGSGDGRIVIRAAQRFGTRGVGVDIDPVRVAEARVNARSAGVQDRVEFRQGDLFDTDLGEATVVTLYLLPEVNARLRPKLLAELRPGTRVVSHAFSMGDWEPERTEVVDGKTLYLWTIPARGPDDDAAQPPSGAGRSPR